MNTTGSQEDTANGLSRRGSNASQSQVRSDTDLFYEAMANLHHHEDNPSGALPMNVAENKLGWTELKAKIEAISASQPLPDWVAGYTGAKGNPEVLAVLAEFMSTHLAQRELDPEFLTLTAGASAAIDLLAFILGDEGDVAAFPAPSYPVYTHDISARAGLERYDLITHHDTNEISNGPILETAHFDEALAKLQADGKSLRLLVITNPDNPTGGMYDRATLETYADWCINHDVHLMVNEIYGLSIIDTQDPAIRDDYEDHRTYTSFVQIVEDRRSDYLHHCYALSKDFGISGFRLGLIYSRNPAFNRAADNLNVAHMASNLTQWTIQQVLADHAFVDAFISNNRKRLTESYIEVVEALRRSGIPYVPSRGSLFVWADFSEFLEDQTQAADHQLWLRIYDATGILLTPGAGFGHTKHGMYRIVYPSLPRTSVHAALSRLEALVMGWREVETA